MVLVKFHQYMGLSKQGFFCGGGGSGSCSLPYTQLASDCLQTDLHRNTWVLSLLVFICVSHLYIKSIQGKTCIFSRICF